MGKSQFDEPMTFAKWWAIRSSALLELKLTPAQWYEKFAGTNIDSGGTPQLMLNTSGEITEASASTISSNTTQSKNIDRYSQGPLFGVASVSDVVIAAAQTRLFQTTLTATAGGEITAADVGPPTKAGYQACMLVTHVWSDQTDAGIAFTIAPSAGAFDTGLTALTIATTANLVTPDYSPGLAWQCATDAATIQWQCAAGQAGNAQNVVICGVYWYET